MTPLRLLFVAAVTLACGWRNTAAAETYPVFVLAGQSNMEGKADNALLERLATAPPTAELFAHWRQEGKWIERDDVFIKFLNRQGPLTIGYGSPNKTGLELEFGYAVGEHYQQPVLLIKTAWGGHSLYQKFRPPSAGLPNDETLEKELAQAQQRVRNNNEKRNRNDPLPTLDQIKAEYGVSYRNMMQEVAATLQNADTLFPALKGKTPEIVGFVWFQGFNDMFGDDAPGEYAQNLKLLIQDVRQAWNKPNLPVVIGALGQNGSAEPSERMKQVQDAQLSMNDVPEFAGNVKTIRTDVLVDKQAEALIEDWQNHVEEWKKVGPGLPLLWQPDLVWSDRPGAGGGDAEDAASAIAGSYNRYSRHDKRSGGAVLEPMLLADVALSRYRSA